MQEETTFKERPNGNVGSKPGDYLGRPILGREMNKDLEARICRQVPGMALRPMWPEHRHGIWGGDRS